MKNNSIFVTVSFAAALWCTSLSAQDDTIVYSASDEIEATSNLDQLKHFDESKTYWWHNGSTVLLQVSGSARQITYESPRPGMAAAGAAKGSLLFAGKAEGIRLSGTAYIFNRKCGRFPYKVTGSVISDKCGIDSMKMEGEAPRVDEGCSITGYKNDELVFELVRFDKLPGTDGNMCE